MAKKAARKSAATANKARTKSEIYAMLSDTTGLSRKEIGSVFDSLATVIKKDLGGRGPGQFTVPGLMKITIKKKPAQKAIKNWTNPFTKEITTKPAKPASKQVKIRPLKALKDMV